MPFDYIVSAFVNAVRRVFFRVYFKCLTKRHVSMRPHANRLRMVWLVGWLVVFWDGCLIGGLAEMRVERFVLELMRLARDTRHATHRI